MAPEHDTELRTPGAPAPGSAAEGEGDRIPPQAADPERPHGDPLAEDLAGPEAAGEAPAAEPEVTADAAEPEADHEAKVARDLDELSVKARKADEYLDLAQRTKADFENYRRRAARDAAAAQERGIAKLAKELLPAVDNLDRALEAAQAHGGAPEPEGDSGDSSLISGIRLVHADVIAALQRAGIERFSPQGEQFDPQHHEAVAQQPVEGAASGTIVEVYQRGYRIGDSVLRPARVVVAE